jgi:hypothetical protein
MTTAAKAALAPALAEAMAAEPEPEQLALLPSRFEPGSRAHDNVMELVRRDRAGRPPNARNLATRQMLDFVRKTFGDPVERRARWLLHTPASLAAELGCTKAEAFDRLDRIAADLSRLFYAPLAPVDGAGNAVPPQFNLTIGGRSQADGSVAPWEYMGPKPVPQVIENAPQSDTAEPVSHGAASHGEDKPL